MKSRPILFSAPMVRALLDGSKTQTRRIYKEYLPPTYGFTEMDDEGRPWFSGPSAHQGLKCPYGAIGDQLWVRETWRTLKAWDHIPPTSLPAYDDPIVMYDADCFCDPIQQDPDSWGKTRVSIHMPRWASRLTLEITNVRAERLQDISEPDAWAEGVAMAGVAFGKTILPSTATGIQRYEALWNSINGPDAWAMNPFVWVLTFKRITP